MNKVRSVHHIILRLQKLSAGVYRATCLLGIFHTTAAYAFAFMAHPGYRRTVAKCGGMTWDMLKRQGEEADA